MSILNCFCSSRMPVGLVTFDLGDEAAYDVEPDEHHAALLSTGPILEHSQRSRSFSGRPTPWAPAARLPRLSSAAGMRARAYPTGSPSMSSTRESPVSTMSGMYRWTMA